MAQCRLPLSPEFHGAPGLWKKEGQVWSIVMRIAASGSGEWPHHGDSIRHSTHIARCCVLDYRGVLW
jgi:hypothetical protein